ncbi:hypothetical protein EFB14_19280 [Rhizobium fabae]|uniref:DNA-directed RNA polymerase subunit RPC12/RpoP n=1 Tax=Rhizobium fabae TaxID=573179 RepID=A0A7W6FJ91_9HYPH|nr:DNA-directed RNA polymerase subunit RPC12/RpoP [Rhizobium fabae]RUM11032.1 hypothetical protein EFB14_19280 [Rhizobium fabae]
MPEIHPFKRLRSWTLRTAQDQGQILVVRCDYCRVTYRYLPVDLLELCGDLTLDKVLDRFRCNRCGKKHYLNLKLHFPHGSEYGSLPVRRLKEVRTVAVPIWSEDVLR